MPTVPRLFSTTSSRFAGPMLGFILGSALLASVPPAEVANLQVEKIFGSAASVTWDASADGFYYQAYIGTLSALPNYCSIHRSPLTETGLVDGTIPNSGDAQIYLATAIGVGGEGELGLTSSGAVRSTTLECDSDLDGVVDSLDNCPDDQPDSGRWAGHRCQSCA